MTVSLGHWSEVGSTGENFGPGSFAEFCHRELSAYVQSRAEVDDSFYKPRVINTQSCTFDHANYVNTIGSKVVIEPLGEILELSVKKKILQRTMVIPQYEKASSSPDAAGYLPSGETPEASAASASGYLPGEIPEVPLASVTGDLPSGEIPGSQAAEVLEDLLSGKRSREEAKDEDVEMNEAQDEKEISQDEQMQVTEEAILRAHDFFNSNLNDAVQARFIDQFLGYELGRIDAVLQWDGGQRQAVHQRRRDAEQRQREHPPRKVKEEQRSGPIEGEVNIYQEELEGRKNVDIFIQPSSAEFVRILKPESLSLS